MVMDMDSNLQGQSVGSGGIVIEGLRKVYGQGDTAV